MLNEMGNVHDLFFSIKHAFNPLQFSGYLKIKYTLVLDLSADLPPSVESSL
jgi:hypothetical protein